MLRHSQRLIQTVVRGRNAIVSCLMVMDLIEVERLLSNPDFQQILSLSPIFRRKLYSKNFWNPHLGVPRPQADLGLRVWREKLPLRSPPPSPSWISSSCRGVGRTYHGNRYKIDAVRGVGCGFKMSQTEPHMAMQRLALHDKQVHSVVQVYKGHWASWWGGHQRPAD